MDELKLIAVAIKNGYEAKDYGYIRKTKSITHWITFFELTLQMYGYEEPDNEMEYDTGRVSVSEHELQMLINILTQNHE